VQSAPERRSVSEVEAIGSVSLGAELLQPSPAAQLHAVALATGVRPPLDAVVALFSTPEVTA
jgi:hypothetical protein